MRYENFEAVKETKNSNVDVILIVSQIDYSFTDRKTKQLEQRTAMIISNSEEDAYRTIKASLPAGQKFDISSFQTRVAEINAITPVMKRLIYNSLAKEFEKPNKQQKTIGNKIKNLAKGIK